MNAAQSKKPDAPTRGSRWFVKIIVEVTFLSIGVFLALMGDQWRESRDDRERAMASLRGFRSEILANQQAVQGVKDYHVDLLARLRAYLAVDPKSRKSDTVRIAGLQPVFFERTAWDLAMATQSLVHIDQDLAFRLSRIYGLQRTYAESTQGVMQAMYLRPLVETFDGLTAYYGDLVLWEPALLKQYEETLPLIDRALGESR